jgi:transposase
MDAPPTYEQLLRENAQLKATVLELLQRIAELERTAKRQAAPFSKGEPKPNPKKPGRKKGDKHGTHAHRDVPPPAEVTETLDAPLPEACPDCGGKVVEERIDEQFQTEIPRKPVVRKFRIHCGHCVKCRKTIRGRHPLQTSDATGAARSQLGGDAQAAIVYLNKHAGMSHGKISHAFDKLFGMKVTPGASAQVVMRAGKILQPAYDEIAAKIKSSKHLTPDETGWRIGGHPAWLHGWVGDEGATLFAIDPQRNAGVLEKVIGIDWSGSMTHDGYSSYERFEDAAHQQCLDHALRRARALVDKHKGLAKRFPQRVIDLLMKALKQRDRFEKEKVPADKDGARRDKVYWSSVQKLRDLTKRPPSNAENATFAKHLRKHAASWFLFLVDPSIPATNYRGEQALKVPIVNRKVWGGNRTKAGAEAQAVTSSVLATCQKKAVDVFAFLGNAFRGTVGKLFPQQAPAGAN